MGTPWLTLLPLLLVPALASVACATAPQPVVAPEPTPSAPIPLPGESGVRLGSPPKVFFEFCESSGGKLRHSVISNQGWAFCVNSPEPFVRLTGIYCGDALSEQARLCALVHEGALKPREEAETATSTWVTTLTSLLGEPSERRELGAVWTNDERDVLVSSNKDDTSERWRVRVLYRSADARLLLEPDPPDFPRSVGGFDFGSTAEDVKAECALGHGRFKLTSESPAPGFECTGPRIESPMDIQGVSGHFCAERVCELVLFVNKRMLQVLPDFIGRYGSGVSSHGPSGQCRSEVDEYRWTWAKGERTTGWMRLTEDCSTAIFYSNADGFKLRDQQPIPLAP